MARFNIQTGSVTSIGNEKTGLTVTFYDEVNGKAPCTCYHEVESIEPSEIEAALIAASLEYESRLAPAVERAEIATGVDVSAEVKA